MKDRHTRLVSVERSDATAVRRTLKLIELLYKVHGTSRKKTLRGARNSVRLCDLELVLLFNHGGNALSNDDAGEDDLKIAIHHLLGLGKPVKQVRAWARDWAPWCCRQRLDGLIEQAAADPRRWTADELAAALGLTYAIRTGLGITTIGAIDCDKAEREAIQNRVDVDRKRAKRRARGAVPREQYEANSLSRRQPWRDAGMSRSKWFKLRKADPASVRQV